MGLSAELSLVLLALGLYFIDSIWLLSPGEGCLVAKRRSWEASLGSEDFQLLRKNSFFGAFIAPRHPIFRVVWDIDPTKEIGLAISEIQTQASAFRFLSGYVWVQFVLMLAVIPICLFRFPGIPLIISICLLYLNLIIHLLFVAFRRHSLNLPWRKFFSITVECMICIPFSVNLIRKLSSQMNVNGDMISLARGLLSSSALDVFFKFLAPRIDFALAETDVGTGQHLLLVQLRESIDKSSV